MLADRAGYITAINAEQLGMAIIELGGGRKQLGDRLDHSTGLEMQVRLGEKIERGQPLVHLFAPPDKAAVVQTMIAEAIIIGDQPVPPPELVVERILPI